MNGSSMKSRASPPTVKRAVESQLSELTLRMGIASERPRKLLEALCNTSFIGPFHDGRKRFSAINGDGVPFQWSVSLGSRRGGLRFIADCGVPGTTISERVRCSRTTLADIGAWLPMGGETFGAFDLALACLLPPAELLDASLMGLCVAAEIGRDGTANLKVYVNGEVGEVSDRFGRFARCLAAFNRHAAIQQLSDLRRVVGDRLVPAFVALDLGATGIGRLKLYFRPTDGTPVLQILAAEAVGCTNAARVLGALHHSFLTGPAYPPKAVDVSVEFPTDDREPGFKVDLRMADFLVSDHDADIRIQRLIERLGNSDEDYRIVRDIVVKSRSHRRVNQIHFVGLASRMDEHQVDVYFHPCPREVTAQ